MSFSDLLENEILDHVFGANVYTSPATVWFGLSTADPGDRRVGAKMVEATTDHTPRYHRIAVE